MSEQTEICDLMETTVQYIRRVLTITKNTAKSYQDGEILDLDQSLELASNLKELLKSIILLSPICEIDAENAVKQTEELIKNIVIACENRDAIYCADVYNFELAELLESWRSTIVAAYKSNYL